MKLGLMLSLVVVCIIGVLNPMVSGTPDRHFSPAAADISLSIDFGNGTIQEFLNLEGNTVYDVTDNVTMVEVEWYGDLVYVLSISGVGETDGSNSFWQYWVNGERVGVAANKYVLDDGDIIEWRFSSQVTDNTNPTTDIDHSLVIGIGILGSVMVSVLVVLWFNNKEVRL